MSITGKIPEGSVEDISDLLCQLKERAKIKVPSITKVSKESAAEFSKTIKQDRPKIYHLESINVVNTEWMHEDQRVSKETFILKLNPKNESQLVVERKQFQSKERKRVIISTADVMGMKLSGNNIVMDLYKPPVLGRKTSKCPWKDEECVTEGGKIVVSMTFLGPTPIKDLRGIQMLSKAIEGGLRQSYPHFKPEKPFKAEEILPLIQDPTLVRAMQLCVIELLQNQHHDRDSIVKLFSQLYQAFQDLLNERLTGSDQFMNHEE